MPLAYFIGIFVVTLIAASIPIINNVLDDRRTRAKLRAAAEEYDRKIIARKARLLEAPKNVSVFERGRSIPVAKKVEPDDV